jgi:hypothetical protein
VVCAKRKTVGVTISEKGGIRQTAECATQKPNGSKNQNNNGVSDKSTISTKLIKSNREMEELESDQGNGPFDLSQTIPDVDGDDAPDQGVVVEGRYNVAAPPRWEQATFDRTERVKIKLTSLSELVDPSNTRPWEVTKLLSKRANLLLDDQTTMQSMDDNLAWTVSKHFIDFALFVSAEVKPNN